SLDENAIAVEQPRDIAVGLRKAGEETPQPANPVVVHVAQEAADARVAAVEPLARRVFHEVVNEFTLIETVEKRREGAEIEPHRADAEEMIVEPHQFGENRPEVLAPRRQFDPHQLLDRVMPGDFVGQRRDIVHPIDDGDVLVVVEVLAELLEAAVEKTDVGNRLDHVLAVERDDDAQRGVRGRMLRSEIERPEIFLVGFFRSTDVGEFQWHAAISVVLPSEPLYEPEYEPEASARGPSLTL